MGEVQGFPEDINLLSFEGILKRFNKLLDEWVETDEHRYNCIGFSEGTGCCIDKKSDKDVQYCGTARDKLNEILLKALLINQEKYE